MPSWCSGRWRPGATWCRRDHVARAAGRRAAGRPRPDPAEGISVVSQPGSPSPTDRPHDGARHRARGGVPGDSRHHLMVRRRPPTPTRRHTCRSVLPGRDGHGADAADLLRRLYPAEHPVIGLGGAADTTVGAVSAAALAIRRAPGAAGAGRQTTQPVPGASPGSWRGCGRPVAVPGTGSRTTGRSDRSCWRRRTRSTTRSRMPPGPSSPRSWGTCCSRSCSTRSMRPRPASSTCRMSSARS